MKKMRLPKTVEKFAADYEKVYKNFKELGAECQRAGPLPDKVRRLVKVGIAAASHSEGAVHSAVRTALAAGISAAEIRHAIVLSITTIGFPGAMAALTWANDKLG